ncbi:DUF6452 family protein [Flavivirga spongiicola]|uniref:DUF6452 family protein n=1 Tax=Flavivirga spongiicola TaxID=421621 RepID=A0ABU7XLM2_9FLAO|nr:DUF6452 family protein [Flavivirga sp. MEBiC05379]MDO5981313.1 DUF6452 family protein [Flavivirga sp. MEBiC05379]
MRKRSLVLFVIITICYISCERDDICPSSTPTTPRLIIDLLDVNNADNKKRVFDLVVVGVGVADDAILADYNFDDTDNLVLPLKTNENTTQYRLIKEATVNDAGTPDDTSDDFIDGNYDLITINYSREEVYVSRACGYKTIFKNVTLNLDASDTDPWIISRQPVTDNQSVEDEAAAHFTMSH